MKRKLLNMILTALLITAFLVVIKANGEVDLFTGVDGSPSGVNLYNATNTFNYDENAAHINSRVAYYNLSLLNGNQAFIQEGSPQITVLTHGLDGDASHWSNDGEGDFAYDDDSLITKIDNELKRNNGPGAQIYLAEMQSSTSFKLYELSSDGVSSGNSYTKTIAHSIPNVSKHIIVVFQASENATDGYNYQVYEEFNYMLSKIVYDVKYHNEGYLPKINLIGHSRGGLTNLEYVLDHPLMIGSVYSVGTPYFGSDTASTPIGRDVAGDSAGLADIIDANVYGSYYDRWNDYYNYYGQINYHAIGGFSDADFFIDSLIDEELFDYIFNVIQQKNYSSLETEIGEAIFDALLCVIKTFIKKHPLLIETASVLMNIIQLINSFSTDPEDEAANRECIIEILADIKYINIDSGSTFIENLISTLDHLKKNTGCPFFMNDTLVDLSSQVGINEHSAPFQNYGFQKYYKCFEDRDYVNKPKKTSSNDLPAVVHNLEAQDEEIISYILSNIDVGATQLFIIEALTSNTAKVVGYRGSIVGDEFEIPSYIDGRAVVEIGRDFFKGKGNGITNLIIPNTVTTIDAYAFCDLSSLEEVEIYGNNLTYIGDHAFSGCENLNTLGLTAYALCIPNGVEYIGEFAFYHTNFATITIGANVEEIGTCAFSYITALTNITVSYQNGQYFAYNGVLYDEDGCLIQYPIGKYTTSFTVPTSISGISIESIADFAFRYGTHLTSINLGGVDSIGYGILSDCTNLTSVTIPNSLSTIGHSMFENCSSLTSISLHSGITSIENFAFRNCTSLAAVSMPDSVLSIGDSAFEGCEDLAYVRLSEELKSIGSCAFRGCELIDSVLISDTVDEIGAEAFRYCESLEEVYVYRCTAPITELGLRAFHDCSDDLMIIVDKDRLTDYKNESWWESYRTRIYPFSGSYTTYQLNQSSDFNFTLYIGPGYSKIIKFDVQYWAGYDFDAFASHDVRLKLYYVDGCVLIKSSIDSIRNLLTNGTQYYLSIEFEDSENYGNVQINVCKNNVHYHNYSHLWYNYTMHLNMCSCGSSNYEPHAVSANAFDNGAQYAECLICHGLASMGLIGPMTNGALPTSANGSFILPNGVVVLVDQDIEAYLEGTLVFITPNDSEIQ